MLKKLNKPDPLDQIMLARITAADFGLPESDPVKDNAWFKTRASIQIKSAIKAISNATNQHDFITAQAQAESFITAALDYEFIDLSEKAVWLEEMATVVRIQTIGESA